MKHRLPNFALRSFALRSLALAGLAGLPGHGLVLPAQAETENKTARPGQRIFLQGFTHYFPTQGCRSKAALVDMVSPPRGGRVEIRREFRILSNKIDERGATIRQVDGCEDVKKDSMSIFYTARSDFSGLDTLSVAVTFPDGTTVPYTFRITVPEGERRQAPAVSQAPAPRGNGAGQAAGTTATAPAARAASTGDFLRDTVRGATPAPRQVPASPPPPAANAPAATAAAAAAAGVAAPPARVEAPPPARIEAPASPPAPREMAPAPRPRPAPMPQL
ncbi:hypothetical protein [Methylobacterium sp. Leaf106]|uniref:hypothetical protein n=1 Tax=Methylobacterium sp. Leaf106 TaxID=1736255 RepID=UPI0006F8F3F4|nr:hypothetical protein [Methylobacterium sp. Leaf106]KQP51587.1 hypothetical protein ASF34_19090 [Methylobacterium sp. Leaf106]